MKKFLNIFTIMLVVLGMGVLVGCNNTSTKTTSFNSDQDMFAFAAASTANIFGGVQKAPVKASYSGSIMKMAAEATDKEEAAKPEQELNMDKINKYVKMMENLLVDNGPVVSNTTASDKEGYETKLEFTVTDLAGVKSTYVIYYNQTLEGEEEKPDEKPDEKPEEEKPEETEKPLAAEALEDDEEDETEDQEQEYTLTGIAIIDDKEYQVKGEKELDVDEYELSITILFDDKNYVTIEEEVEEDEHEYEYTVVENGEVSMEVEFELENSKEVEIEIVTMENGEEAVYEFEKEEKNGQTVIIIKHEQNGKKYEIKGTGKLNPETNKIEYTYKEKSSDKEYHYQDGNEHADED